MRTLPLHAWVLLAAHSAAQDPPSEAPVEEAPVDEKWRCYAARHPDLRAGYCTNPGELKTCNWGELADHWATHGYDEGRHVECHSWDTECYLTRYPDIYEGFCHSTVSGMYEKCEWVRILEHMAVAGQEEGRDESACATKDLRCYALRYPDLLAGFCAGDVESCDWTRLAEHWKENGPADGRTWGCAEAAYVEPADMPEPPPVDNVEEEVEVVSFDRAPGWQDVPYEELLPVPKKEEPPADDDEPPQAFEPAPEPASEPASPGASHSMNARLPSPPLETQPWQQAPPQEQLPKPPTSTAADRAAAVPTDDVEVAAFVVVGALAVLLGLCLISYLTFCACKAMSSDAGQMNEDDLEEGYDDEDEELEEEEEEMEMPKPKKKVKGAKKEKKGRTAKERERQRVERTPLRAGRDDGYEL